MIPTCSVIIPSRNRPDGLLKAINSIIATADDPTSIEIIIGLDNDDAVSIARIREFEAVLNTRVHVWPRAWLQMISDLAQLAKGDWVLVFNDDATIEGNGWDTQLRQLPKTGVMCQPETYRLGESRYLHAIKTGFPWFPNKCWETFRCSGQFIPHPCDYAAIELAQEHRWRIEFLKGITVFHDRHE